MSTTIRHHPPPPNPPLQVTRAASGLRLSPGFHESVRKVYDSFATTTLPANLTTVEIPTPAIACVWKLRHRVMWPNDQFDSVKIDGDEDPSRSFHLGMIEGDSLVSAISVFVDPSDNSAQFRKFATESWAQKRGYGTRLLSATIEACRERGVTKLWCDARVEQTGWYEKRGLALEGEPFEKYKGAGMYVKMATEIVKTSGGAADKAGGGLGLGAAEDGTTVDWSAKDAHPDFVDVTYMGKGDVERWLTQINGFVGRGSEFRFACAEMGWVPPTEVEVEGGAEGVGGGGGGAGGVENTASNDAVGMKGKPRPTEVPEGVLTWAMFQRLYEDEVSWEQQSGADGGASMASMSIRDEMGAQVHCTPESINALHANHSTPRPRGNAAARTPRASLSLWARWRTASTGACRGTLVSAAMRCPNCRSLAPSMATRHPYRR